MARKVGGWIVLVLVLGTGAWLELSVQGSQSVFYEESTYGMQADAPNASSTNVAQAQH